MTAARRWRDVCRSIIGELCEPEKLTKLGLAPYGLSPKPIKHGPAYGLLFNAALESKVAQTTNKMEISKHAPIPKIDLIIEKVDAHFQLAWTTAKMFSKENRMNIKERRAATTAPIPKMNLVKNDFIKMKIDHILPIDTRVATRQFS